MRWFKGKNVDDSLYEFVSVFAEKFGDNIIIVLQNFIKTRVYSVFFELYGMIKDDFKPIFADIEFGDSVAFDNLPDKVVRSVEHFF